MAKLIKLHRSYKHRVLAGVFGGIAEYFEWNVLALRLLFLLSIPLTMAISLGVAIVLYLIAWMIMPNATAESYIE